MAHKLKRLSYVSQSVSEQTSTVPGELAAIVIQSRRFNHSHGITGFLTWRNGYYFQVLEGSAPTVDALYAKVARDPRHTDLERVWVEHQVPERFFSGWRLKLWSASLSCSEVNRYIHRYEKSFGSLNQDIQERLKSIFDLDLIFNSEPGDLPDRRAIGNYEFRLQALPSLFGLSAQHPRYIDVITMLLADWTSPEQLSARFGLSANEVYKLLSHKKVNSLLLKRSAQSRWANRAVSGSKTSSESSGGRSFYDRLRSVLTASNQ